jgi:hypothetical protein
MGTSRTQNGEENYLVLHRQMLANRTTVLE